ncbi:MAG: crosslink repair DNA glycosylase YcaQ family protein [Microthrixaceae bacterium]
MAAISAQLQSTETDGKVWWFIPPAASSLAPGGQVHLLSIYDEYVIGYKEWSVVIDAANAAQLQAMGNNLTAVVILDGRIIGTWKRSLGKRQATITTSLFCSTRPCRTGCDCRRR